MTWPVSHDIAREIIAGIAGRTVNGAAAAGLNSATTDPDLGFWIYRLDKEIVAPVLAALTKRYHRKAHLDDGLDDTAWSAIGKIVVNAEKIIAADSVIRLCRRIIVNTYFDDYRKLRRETNKRDVYEAYLTASDRRLHSVERQKILAYALSKLPRLHRIVMMHLARGTKKAEIRRRLSRSKYEINTVIEDARARIIDYLKNLEDFGIAA